ALAFGQRDEFRLAGDRRKSAASPVFFRLFDPLLARRDEIPPDVARAFHSAATEKHHARSALRANGDPVTRTEDKEPRALERVAGDLNLSFHEVDRALLIVRIERRARAR